MVNARDRELPLDKYLLNSEQSLLIQDARVKLVSKCMRRYGFEFSVPRAADTTSGMGEDAPRTRVDGRYGYQSMAHATTWGYHPAGGVREHEPVSTDDSKYSDPEWSFAARGTSDPRKLFGPGGRRPDGQVVPERGCAGEALRRLTGSLEGDLGDSELATSLKFETLANSQKDSDTREVFGRWSECMKREGYSYPDPLAALADPRWRMSGQPTSREIRVAVADQRCRKQENVVGVWFGVDQKHQEEAVARHATSLVTVKERIDQMIKNAKAVLDE